MGKHRDEWSREQIAKLMWLGYELSHFFPIRAEVEHKVHRGFVDVAWYITFPSTKEKFYLAVFEIETSKSDWPRIRNNAAKIVSLKPLVVFHLFKPSVRLKKSEREELMKIHHGRKVYVVNTKKGIENIERDLAEALSGETDLAFDERILRVPQLYVDWVDELVEKGFYLTRGEAIRFAINSFLTEEVTGISRKHFIPCPKCGSYKVHFDYKDRKAVCVKCGNITTLSASI